MSFMDEIGKLAGSLLSNATPQQAASAAADHINSTDPNELAGHLQQSVGNMDSSSLSALGGELLQAFASHPASTQDPGAAAASAGTTQQAVANGEPGAVAALIDYAKNNPQILQAAATSFTTRNPQAIEALAPQLLQGIMGRLNQK